MKLYNKYNLILLLVITACWSPLAVRAQGAVTWTSLFNASVNGAGLIKTGTTAAGGAISTQVIPAGSNGYIEFVLGSTNNGYIGLSSSNPDANSNTINFAIKIDRTKSFDFYENGSRKFNGEKDGPMLYSTSIFRIERIGTTIVYKMNGVVLYTSLTSSTLALFVDTSMATVGNTLPGVSLLSVTNFGAPGGLTAVGSGTDAINLTWNDNSSIETGFEIERSSTVHSGFVLIATTAANITSYTNTGLTANTRYFYRVRAIRAGSPSSYSSTVEAYSYGLSTWYSNEGRTILVNGNVGIGTSIPDAKLTVKGKIHAEEVKVDLAVPGPDYVFEPSYGLQSLEDLERYIQQYKHLPEVPSAKVMETEGVDLGTMNMLLLKKIEELTLHLISQEKRLRELEKIQQK